jgi:beta-N-acetylhexosaminidase
MVTRRIHGFIVLSVVAVLITVAVLALVRAAPSAGPPAEDIGSAGSADSSGTAGTDTQIEVQSGNRPVERPIDFIDDKPPSLYSDTPIPPEDRVFWEDAPTGHVLETLMAQMSDEEIVAQVFLLGWDTPYPNTTIMSWIRTRNIGGVKIFGWNGENVQTLARTVGTMQSAALETPHGIPLFTATDQEGGWVRHIKHLTSITPGNMALGATGIPEDAYQTGYFIGRELRALGVNMNFAPTVDIYTHAEAHVIGPRAFSDDPVQTAVLGTAFFKGLEENRVIATAKHFPGHGGAEGDSHGVLPSLDVSFQELWEIDLVPYRIMIREGLPSIMSGHLSFPVITGDNTPASFSRYFKQSILRSRLGFDGIIITDDLYMEGARRYERDNGMTFGELCLDALANGSDMIMLSRTPGVNDEIWRTVLNAYRSDPEFRNTLNNSVKRILRTKLEYLRHDDRVPLRPDPDILPSRLPDPKGTQFFFEHASRSVTVLGNAKIPLNPEPDDRVLLVGNNPFFFREGLARFPGADTMSLSSGNFYTARIDDRVRFRSIASRYDTVIYCLSSPATQQILKEAAAFPGKTIVVSILTPIYLQELPWVETAIALYGWGTDSFRAGFAVLRGDFPGEGHIPFSFSEQ